jgi:hypothetical protein
MEIRDRIVELRRVPACELRANPKNWRRHPRDQANALRGVLEEVGYADALLARDTEAGLELIDGHLRAETTPDAEVPVLVLDVSAAEADKILATLDPLSSMAVKDEEAYASLLATVETDSEALRSMLDGFVGTSELDGRGTGTDPGEMRYREQYGVIVVCQTAEEQERVYEDLTERGYSCRVVVT